ncbi:hypothetical protein [Nocardioides sp. 616]|nr:hypothetical protein [Nocardioides sp. 616]
MVTAEPGVHEDGNPGADACHAPCSAAWAAASAACSAVRAGATPA